jgi:hypothetical protein
MLERLHFLAKERVDFAFETALGPVLHLLRQRGGIKFSRGQKEPR